jgi:adenylate cyclase class 2
VELKARCQDLAQAMEVAGSLGAVDADRLEQLDTYFQCGDGRLKLREISSREAGESAELIWYARADDESARTSRYLVLDVPHPAAVRDSLDTGLGTRVVVRKTRQLFLWENVRIHLDDVDDLGCFLEFEAVLDEGQDEAYGYAQLERLRSEFGIDDGDLVGGSYSDLAS